MPASDGCLSWRRPSRRPRSVAACLSVLALVGCSSSSPEEEAGSPDTSVRGDAWCRIVSEEQVEQLLGEEDLERVQQRGDFQPNSSPRARCDVVWTDTDREVWLVSGFMSFADGRPNFRDVLVNLPGVVGEEGERLSSGEVVQVQPGTYVDVERRELAVFLTCDSGESLPTVMSAQMIPEATESGEHWAPEEFEQTAVRLAELTESVYQCPGEVYGLGAEDWEPLLEQFFDETA